MAKQIAKRYLGPEYKSEPEPLIPDISTKEDFLKLLSVVIRSGEGGRCVHPLLPGRDYSQEDIDYAIMILIAAEKRILHFAGAVDGEIEVPLIERLKANKAFREAVENAELSKEMSIVLHEIDIGKRMTLISSSSPEMDVSLVRSCAIEDVMLCAAIAREHIKLSKPEDLTEDVQIGLRLVRETIRGTRMPEVSMYSFTLGMLDDIRWIRSQSERYGGDVDRAFEDYHAAMVVLADYDLMKAMGFSAEDAKDSFLNSRVEELAGNLGKLDACFAVAGELRILERHIGRISKPGKISDLESQSLAVSDLRLALELASEYDKLRVSGLRGEQLGPQMSRMMEKADSSRTLSSVELALDAIVEIRAEEELAKLEPPKPALEIPRGVYDHNLDQQLEEIIPRDDDERSRLIREICRTFSFYVRAEVPYPLVPPLYRHAIGSLRGDYSPQGALRMATEIVDMSMGKCPVDEKIFARTPNQIDKDDYETTLSLLRPDALAMVTEQFGVSLPSFESLENALILIDDTSAVLRNKVLGGITLDGSTTQMIAGTYDEATAIINSFDDAELDDGFLHGSSRFAFRLDRISGKVSLLEGWDNPHLRELDGMQIVQEMKTLVFPLPNVAVNMDLEEALNNSFPREIDGQESKRNIQIRSLARMLVLYAGLNSPDEDSANHLAELIGQKSGQVINSEIPELYEEAVSNIQQDHSVGNIIRVSVTLVNKYGERIQRKIDTPVPSSPPPSEHVEDDSVEDYVSIEVDVEGLDESPTTKAVLPRSEESTGQYAETQDQGHDPELVELHEAVDSAYAEAPEGSEGAKPALEAAAPSGMVPQEDANVPEPRSTETLPVSMVPRQEIDLEPTVSIPAKRGRTAEERFGDLMMHERELVSRLMGVPECDISAFKGFLAMDPGVRELRMQNLISSMWTEGDFSKDISKLQSAKDSIYRTCQLHGPSEEQKLLAIADVNSLTNIQKSYVSSFFGAKPENLTPDHVLSFGLWLRGDQKELREYWDRQFPEISEVTLLLQSLLLKKRRYGKKETALIRRIRGKPGKEKLTPEDFDPNNYTGYLGRLRNYHGFHFSTPKEERLAYWKKGMVNLLTAAELSYKVIYNGDLSLNDSEKRLLSFAEDKDISQIHEDHIRSLAGAFMQKTYTEEDDENAKSYFPQILRLARHGDSMKLGALLFAGRRQGEFNTLAEFLGCDVPGARTILHTAQGKTVPKIRKGQYCKTNDDCFSSATIHTPQGEIRLHAVFDGMGGHASGDVASNLARVAFEICAVAGWIQKPEDMRKVFILADIAIAMEAISRKQFSHQFQEPQCNMGTTATAAMRIGRELYGIHCGDSPYKVLREGRTVYEAIEHNLPFEMRMRGIPFDPNGIPNNIVVAALGASTKYISINNSIDTNYSPFILNDGDVLMVASDGITDVVDDTELHYMMDVFNGDLSDVMNQLIEVAEERAGAGPFSSIIPGSQLEIAGKGSDDKTVIMERLMGLEK